MMRLLHPLGLLALGLLVLVAFIAGVLAGAHLGAALLGIFCTFFGAAVGLLAAGMAGAASREEECRSCRYAGQAR